jgi:hypothetical protein
VYNWQKCVFVCLNREVRPNIFFTVRPYLVGQFCSKPGLLEVGRAWFFGAQFGLGLHTLGSGFYGLKKLLNKLGLRWDLPRDLLNKLKIRVWTRARPTSMSNTIQIRSWMSSIFCCEKWEGRELKASTRQKGILRWRPLNTDLSLGDQEPNPTIMSYNASAVKIYSARSSLQSALWKKNFFFCLEKML